MAAGRRFARILVFAVLGYGLVLFLAWKYQDRLAFPAPGKALPAPADHGLTDGRQVTVTTADTVRLRGWFLPPRPAPVGTAPALIWFNDRTESVATLAGLIRDLRPPGTAVLVLDYRGYGESGGTPTEAGLYRDAEAAWAFLASRPVVDRSRIGVYGRGLGTAMALHVAAERRVRVVVLHAPFTNARDLFRRRFWFLPEFVWRLELDNLSPARRLRQPLLVIHGANDRVVPLEMGRAVAQAGRARELFAVAGAGHGNLHDVAGDAYREKLHAFLSAVLGQ